MDQMESCVPPGFRFHPTEEELVGFYLKRKVNSLKFDLDVIIDIDLYRMEPWDIQDKCKLGYNEQSEWYFFSHKDRKYPTGTRTNRATAAGFWKATGRDKAVLSKDKIIGMRKTLVFYRGRAPNGRKTDWIMHEYRLQTTEHAPPQEEGWVVCRAFKKPSPNHKQGYEAWNHQNNYYYIRNNTIASPSSDHHHHHHHLTDSLNQRLTNFQHPQQSMHHPTYNNTFDHQEFISSSSNTVDLLENHLITDLPRLDSPSYDHHHHQNHHQNHDHHHDHHEIMSSNKWEILDSFLGDSSSQIMSENTANSHDYEIEVQNQLGSFLEECFPNL